MFCSIMKKRLLSSIIIWLLSLWSSFAQESEYPYCSQVTNWIISCQEKQVCNNPDGFCRCKISASPFNSATEHYIPHNTSCFANTELVKNKIISSFAVSGSIVTFKFTIQNDSTAKSFELRLPATNENPRIKILDINSDWTCNWWNIWLLNWFFNPVCSISANQTKTIVITGQVASSSFTFDRISTNTCLKNIWSNNCINNERTTATIFPTTNYSISQRLLEPKPIFDREQAIYEITVQNNWSKISNESIKLTSTLGSFLWEPQLFLNNEIINNSRSTNLWQLWTISAWTTKTYLMKAWFVWTPPALTVITTTSNISGWNEMILYDNTATTSYTIPKFLDLQISKIEKTNEEPETSGNKIWFIIWYKNKWNEDLKELKLNAFVDWIDLKIEDLELPVLNSGALSSILITGNIDKIYPIGTKFCLSWSISASNETESLENNVFSGVCYTFVKSADLTIDAVLENQTNTINSWSLLTYKINILNKWQKTANNVSVKLFPSNNQVSQNPTNITWISLVWWEKKEIIYTSLLKSYPIEGTSISLSGNISFTGIDLDPTNNNFEIKQDLPALSDVYIDLKSQPFSGFKIGDEIIYTISYGNSGLESARNPMIKLELPSFVKTDQTERSLWKSISAGAAWNFVVTWSLTENLAVGTQFITKAGIYVDSAQVTTGNDISVLTSTVIEYNNISFEMSVQNASWAPGNIWPQSIKAASGHNITFTINYVNDGNVPANNVNISLPNTWPLTINSFNNNLGTIWIWQQGSVSIQGKINWINFSQFTPTATISYNNESITRSVTIEEPYECGDWLITKDEPCDTALPMNYWTGLACENQWWVCILTTKFISNTACIEVWTTTVCSEAIINLKDPKCEELTVRKNPNNDNQVDATCLQQYAFAWTPYRIVCGSDNILTWLVWVWNFWVVNNFIQRTCNYSNPEIASASTIRCEVWNEIGTGINNPYCTKRVPSCEVDVDSKVVILDQWEWNVRVQCSVNSNQEASLRIDCWNGKSEIVDGKIMEHTCTYTNSDLFGTSSRIKDIRCEVDGIVSCENDIILDEGIMGICGDGIRQGYEQCDLWPGTPTIYSYLDNNFLIAPYGIANQWKKCINCSIDGVAPAQCLSVHNGNISIEKWEYLPLWWRVDQNSFTSALYTDCSNPINNKKIIMSTMMCTFGLQKPGWDRKDIFTRRCESNPDENLYSIFNYFNQYFTTNTWRYAIPPSDFNSWVGNTLGEYKLRLNKITYDYCEDWQRKNSQTDNVCETNFTITKPYLVQKSAFGITPKATNINLKEFKDFDGRDIVTRTDLANVMILDTNDYQSFDVDFMVNNFVDTAEKLAVNTKTPPWLSKDWVTAKKVPNKDIYILYKNGWSITIKKDAKVTKPFTLIVKWAELIVEWNIEVNGMFIVKDGKIKFVDENCNQPQRVKGIFIAKDFDATKRTNSSLYTNRCNAWWLHVKWVLIGWWIEDLVKNKRSTLSRWFNVSWSERAIEVQRRNMIFNWASVLIEYSPELWQQLPPGADEFTKMLDVYKK